MMWKTKATATTETQAENAFILGFFTYKQPLDGDKLPSGKPELSDLYLFDSVGKRKEGSLTENDETSTRPSINGKYLLAQNTLYNDDYTYAVLDHLYANRNNLTVLDYKAPKPEEPKKETK